MTGLHFMTWLRTELMADPIFRRNLPLYESEQDVEKYFFQLQEALKNALTSENYQRFVHAHRSRILGAAT